MLAQDLTAALDYLGVNTAELASLTGESLDRCLDWAGDRSPVPYWLDQLLYCWCEHPETLDMARDGVEARNKAATIDQTAAETLAIARAADRQAPLLN